jgi:putative tryptophan/tyrosine transport system substrate-binding protein
MMLTMWCPALGRSVVLVVGLLAAAFAADAQQANKVYRIGFLHLGPPPVTWFENLRTGLRELGYVEGQNLQFEYGLAQNPAQLPELAADLVRRKVDVLLASGTPSVLPARNATSTIPVVFVASIDPVASGAVRSLARPGGNVTGVTSMYADVIGKRIELLQELLPKKLARVAVLARDHPGHVKYVQEAEVAARTLGVPLQILIVRDARELEDAFTAARGATAVLQLDDALFTSNRTRVAQLALKHRLPAMVGHRELVEVGGLVAYGAHYPYLYRRSASFVDKILKGTKPGNLPVEQPAKFELVLNLKTAKELGLTIPSSLLSEADELIE